MRKSFRPVLCLLVATMLGLALNPAGAAEKPSEYLSLFPAGANTVMVIKVAEIKETPKAKEAGWSSQKSDFWLAGSEHLPVWVDLVVRAGHFHLGVGERDWTLSVVPLPSSRPFSQLIRANGQKSQSIEGRQLFRSSQDNYVVHLTDGVVGVLTPADRADLSRWIRYTQLKSKLPLASYLTKAASNEDAEIVFATDLRDTFDKWELLSWLQASPVLKDRGTELTTVFDLLQTIVGLTVNVDIDKGVSAEIRVTFGEAVKSNPGSFKGLLLEYLGHQGAYLEDLEKAVATTEGNDLVLTMKQFSDSGLQNVLSLMLSQSPSRPAVAKQEPDETPANDAPQPAGEPTVEKTEAYYDAIQTSLADLEKKYRSSNNYDRTATWHEKYAQKIDQLPLDGVDPAMIAYGQETSARLRALSASLRGVPVEVNTLQNAITYNYNYYSNWRAVQTVNGVQPTGVDVQTNVSDVRAAQANAVNEGAKDRDQIWQMLVESRNKIRTEMFDKYKVDFGLGDKGKKK